MLQSNGHGARMDMQFFLAVWLEFTFARNLEYRCCLFLLARTGHLFGRHVTNKVRLNNVRVERLSLGPWGQVRRPRVRPLKVQVPKGPDTPTGPEPEIGRSSHGPWDRVRKVRFQALGPLGYRGPLTPVPSTPKPWTPHLAPGAE